MARSHAKILVSTWRNDEWRHLSMGAQWLYWVLLSQPKLTLVGSLEVTPGRWAQYAAGLTRTDIDRAFEELIEAEAVLHDPETDELLIRTFTTHDIDPRRVNKNLAKGLWGQWAGIESAFLRREAVLWMPDAVWDALEAYADPDAVQIRRSGRLEPGDEPRSEPESEPRSEPPPSSHLPTDASHRGDFDRSCSRSVDKSSPLVRQVEEIIGRVTAAPHLRVVGEGNPATERAQSAVAAGVAGTNRGGNQ